MSLQVGSNIADAGKLERALPTFQLRYSQGQQGLCRGFKLEILPTGFPTFQLPLCRRQLGFPKLESWKIPYSYGEVCPGRMPGTPSAPSFQVSLNQQQQEKSAWAD